MRIRRIDRVVWAWMIVAALMAAGWSPVAMAPGRSIGGWSSVCTSSGASTSGESGGAPSVPASSHPFGHCPICSLHGALLGPPPPAGCVFALLPLVFVPPRLLLAAPPTAHGWLPAQPRGPPMGR
jgi:hypothetical protein